MFFCRRLHYQLLALPFIATLLGSAAAAAPGVSPAQAKGVIEGVIEDLRDAVRQNLSAIEADPSQAAELVDAIVSPHVDAERIGRLILGRHGRDASPEQRQRFVDEFRVLLLRTYATQVGDYVDVDVTYLEPQPSADGSRVTVPTRVARRGGAGPVRVDYGMHNLDGSWKVFDVSIDGISLVATLRPTISSEIERFGMEGMLARLADKNRGVPVGDE